MSDLQPETLKLLERMTGPAPSHPGTGEPIDLAKIDALALGDLWQAAHAIDLWGDRGPARSLAADTARAVLDLSKNMEPAFRGSVCRDHLDRIASKAEKEAKDKKPETEPDYSAAFPLEKACFVLARCVDLSFEGLGPAAKRLLAVTRWRARPQIAVALARLAERTETTRVTWITRRGAAGIGPVARIADDRLSERAALASQPVTVTVSGPAVNSLTPVVIV